MSTQDTSESDCQSDDAWMESYTRYVRLDSSELVLDDVAFNNGSDTEWFYEQCAAAMQGTLTPDQECVLDSVHHWDYYKALITPFRPIPSLDFGGMLEMYKKLDEEGVMVSDDYVTPDGIRLGRWIMSQMIYGAQHNRDRIANTVVQWRVKWQMFRAHASLLEKKTVSWLVEDCERRERNREDFTEEESDWLTIQKQRYIYSKIFEYDPSMKGKIMSYSEEKALRDIMAFAMFEERVRYVFQYSHENSDTLCHASLSELLGQ